MDEEVTILCVDDEQNVLNSLIRLFIDYDYNILTATSGSEGLEILKKEKVQIVISDYRMPVMNGAEFLKEVVKLQPETVRIVLSGFADTSSILSAINEGDIYKFIPKPWNDEELKVTISNAIEHYYLVRKNEELANILKIKNEELTEINNKLINLLDEKSLIYYQDSFNKIAIGIIETGPDIRLIQYNTEWENKFGNAISGDVNDSEAKFKKDIKDFILEIENRNQLSKKITLNDITGTIMGCFLSGGEAKKNIILIFSPSVI